MVDNQKYHFDRRKAEGFNEDSRIHFAVDFINASIELWDYGTSVGSETVRKLALEKLGNSLHCIQDYSSHGNYGVDRDTLPSNHWANADNENYDWDSKDRNSLEESDRFDRMNETLLDTGIVLFLFVYTREGSFCCRKCDIKGGN